MFLVVRGASPSVLLCLTARTRLQNRHNGAVQPEAEAEEKNSAEGTEIHVVSTEYSQFDSGELC